MVGGLGPLAGAGEGSALLTQSANSGSNKPWAALHAGRRPSWMGAHQPAALTLPCTALAPRASQPSKLVSTNAVLAPCYSLCCPADFMQRPHQPVTLNIPLHRPGAEGKKAKSRTAGARTSDSQGGWQHSCT